jgi:hypothetical protein
MGYYLNGIPSRRMRVSKTSFRGSAAYPLLTRSASYANEEARAGQKLEVFQVVGAPGLEPGTRWLRVIRLVRNINGLRVSQPASSGILIEERTGAAADGLAVFTSLFRLVRSP